MNGDLDHAIPRGIAHEADRIGCISLRPVLFQDAPCARRRAVVARGLDLPLKSLEERCVLVAVANDERGDKGERSLQFVERNLVASHLLRPLRKRDHVRRHTTLCLLGWRLRLADGGLDVETVR